MATNPVSQNLPADLPENWVYGQTVAPQGSDAELATQYGYNYLMEQVNAAQTAINTIGAAFLPLPVITQVPATLSASGWSGSPLKQTVSVPGATVSGAGLVQPVPSSDQGLTYWNDAGVIALQLTEDGQMTFQADSAPAGDIPLAITITALGVTG